MTPCSSTFLRTAIMGLVAVVAAGVEAGTIPVDSTADTDNPANGTITLREALRIASGARAPGVVGSPSEADQITGSVGAGITDSIHVVLAGGQTITLGGPLPALSDPNDSILVDSFLNLDGSGLSAGSGPAFRLTTPGHSIAGFHFSGFREGAYRIESANNEISGALINSCGTGALVVAGSGATGNYIHDCEIALSRPSGTGGVFDPSFSGLVVRDGASHNLFQFLHIWSNDGNGVHVTGTGTMSNTFVQLNVGIGPPPANDPGTNRGFGILVDGGASMNRFGDPNSDAAFTFVTGNAQGGIHVTGAGTAENLFHSLAIGKAKNDSSDFVWVGNGTGPGFLVDGGATNNDVGKPGANCPIIVGGHQSHAYVFSGAGTTGNDLFRAYAGKSPLPGVPPEFEVIPNAGHGIWVTGGAGNMTIGGSDDMFSQFEIEGVTAGHGLFLDGNNPASPIKNIVVGAYHMGDLRTYTPGTPSIIGHGVVISGHVDGVTLGLAGHRNTTTGAAGYGVVVTGPNVKNVNLIHVFASEGTEGLSPNDLGGLLISDGAGPVTVSGPSFDEQCWFSGNGLTSVDPRGGNVSPGIRIDATNPASLPHDITVQHTKVGPSFFGGGSLPNTGVGIDILGPPSGPPVALSNIVIGPDCIISGNLLDGISLKNVNGVQIVKNWIGLDAGGTGPLPNVLNGIRLELAESCIIGDGADPQRGNVISGNAAAGILLANGCHSNLIQGNLIGTNATGTGAVGNVSGIQVTAPGPPTGFSQTIGGSSARVTPTGGALGQGNVISGNKDGILIATGGSGQVIQDVRIQGNLIGTNPAGTGPMANTENGIELFNSGIIDILIGDRNDASRGNVISGNGIDGVRIDSIEGFAMYNNAIGTDRGRGFSISNVEDGVSILDVQSGKIGTTESPHAGNVISGNGSAGIRVEEKCGSNQFRICHNLIGTNGDGSDAIPNTFGIVVQQTDAPPLAIGGFNAAISNETASTLNQGNLISGNSHHGIHFIEGDGSLPGIGVASALGNIIGLKLDGSGAIPNGEAGIKLDSIRNRTVIIGGPTDDTMANLISGNIGDGIHIGGQSTNGAGIYRNRIGTGIDKTFEVPNGRHGILIDEDSSESHIQENIIHFNGDNGIRIAGSSSSKNQLSKNSIHRNKHEGIKLEGGANNSLQPPKFHLENNNGTVDVKSEPGALVEIFADPTTDKDGYWGQGKKFLESATANSNGFARLNYNGSPEGGIITMTATLDHTTSEFTPFMKGAITQAVDGNQPDLLVAGKRTVFQVRANTGVRGPGRQVTGEFTLGSQVFPQTVTLKNKGEVDSQESIRKQGKDGLTIDLGKPGAGAQAASFLLKSGSFEVGKMDLGTVNFQATQPFALVGYKVEAPVPGGGGSTAIPSEPAMLAAATFMANAFPLEPDEFLRRFRISPVPIKLNAAPHNEEQWLKMNKKAARRLNEDKDAGKTGDVAASFVSSQVQFGPANTKRPNGFRFSATTPQVVAVLDKLPTGEGTGGVLAHELGHYHGLPDTYSPDTRDSNGQPTIPPDPSIPHDGFGILIEENDFGHSPEGIFKGDGFASPGPVFSAGINARTAHDFMGMSLQTWAEPRAYRTLFTKLGGSADRGVDAPSPAPEVSQAMVVFLNIDSGGTVSITSTDRVDATVVRPPSGIFGDVLTVELLDGEGALLDSQDVGTDLVIEQLGTDSSGNEFGTYSDASSSPMAVVLQDDASATTINVKRGSTILDSISKSANAPTIELTGPSGPGLPSGPTTISWTVNDADGDPAVVDLLYTPDGGATTYPIDVGLTTETSIEVDLSRVPTGPAPMLMARAGDGFNITQVNSATYTVPDREPSVEILSPESLSQIDLGFPFAFEAAAWDPEDGALLGSSMTWTLNGNPTIVATGMHPVIQLAEGTTVVRVTVDDSFGNSVFAEITITITQLPPPFDQVAAFVAGIVDSLEGSDRNLDTLTDTGDVREAIEVDSVPR